MWKTSRHALFSFSFWRLVGHDRAVCWGSPGEGFVKPCPECGREEQFSSSCGCLYPLRSLFRGLRAQLQLPQRAPALPERMALQTNDGLLGKRHSLLFDWKELELLPWVSALSTRSGTFLRRCCCGQRRCSQALWPQRSSGPALWLLAGYNCLRTKEQASFHFVVPTW